MIKEYHCVHAGSLTNSYIERCSKREVMRFSSSRFDILLINDLTSISVMWVYQDLRNDVKWVYVYNNPTDYQMCELFFVVCFEKGFELFPKQMELAEWLGFLLRLRVINPVPQDFPLSVAIASLGT